MKDYIPPQIELFEYEAEEMLSSSQIGIHNYGTDDAPLSRHRGAWDSSQWSNNNQDYWDTGDW